MKLCLVSLDFKPYRSSGLTIYAEDLARGLHERGHAVTVLAAQRDGLPRHHWVDEIEVRRLPIDRLDWFTYSLRVAHELEQLSHTKAFDLVHFLDVHFAYAFQDAFVASLWQSFHQRLTARHGGPYHTGRLDWFRRQVYYRFAERCLERPSLARAERLIAGCHSTRDEFVNWYHVAPDKIDVALQGIDTNIFRPMSCEGLRRQLGLEHCRVLLFIGFITPRKGLEYLAQALQQLPEDVHLLIGGRWDGRYRQQFWKIVGTAAARVHEIGFLRDEDRPCYYSLADLYVSPSILEGLGVTPIEAMACGTPAVVTSASSGSEEVGDAGLVVPPCDAQALADSVRLLLDDPSLRQQLAHSGRERVLKHFSYQRMTELTLNSYKACGKGVSINACGVDQSL